MNTLQDTSAHQTYVLTMPTLTKLHTPEREQQINNGQKRQANLAVKHPKNSYKQEICYKGESKHKLTTTLHHLLLVSLLVMHN